MLAALSNTVHPKTSHNYRSHYVVPGKAKLPEAVAAYIGDSPNPYCDSVLFSETTS